MPGRLGIPPQHSQLKSAWNALDPQLDIPPPVSLLLFLQLGLVDMVRPRKRRQVIRSINAVAVTCAGSQ